jgi:hypothetical protein
LLQPAVAGGDEPAGITKEAALNVVLGGFKKIREPAEVYMDKRDLVGVGWGEEAVTATRQTRTKTTAVMPEATVMTGPLGRWPTLREAGRSP